MKSALYVANTTSNAVTVGNPIPLGSIIRRCGCGLSLNGNAITVSGCGYYDVDASFDILGSGTGGVVTITLYMDGIAIPGAEGSVTTEAGSTYHMSIPALVRKTCNCNVSNLTAILSGVGATITNVGIVVDKE